MIEYYFPKYDPSDIIVLTRILTVVKMYRDLKMK